MAKEAQAMEGKRRTFCRDHGEKSKKWCVLVHFGAWQRLGRRLRSAPPAVRKLPVRGFSGIVGGELSALRCIQKIEKVMQNDAK